VNQDQLEDVRADIYAEPWKDPQLFPDLLHKAITELGHLAADTRCALRQVEDENPCLIWPEVVAEWAASLLRDLQHRARSGVPFGEPSYGDLGPTNPKDV
jgi:hypothetical protein